MSNVIQFPIQGVSTIDALRHCVLCTREIGEIDVVAGAQLLNALDTVEQLYLSLTEGEEPTCKDYLKVQREKSDE